MEIFFEQISDLFDQRRSGKSRRMFYVALALAKMTDFPISIETYSGIFHISKNNNIIEEIDSVSKSRDWAKWFWKAVQRFPPLLTSNQSLRLE